MPANQKQFGITEYAAELIHHKARQLVGKAGLTRDDVDDVEQRLIMDLLERLPKFDPAKGTYNTFVARVTERQISKLLRYRLMQARDYRREACSLNDEVDDGDGEAVEHIQTISQDEHDLRTGKHNRLSADRTDLQLDVSQAVARLSGQLRWVAQMLMVMPIAQVARKLGTPRSTFYDTCLAELRDVFEARGLRGYVL